MNYSQHSRQRINTATMLNIDNSIRQIHRTIKIASERKSSREEKKELPRKQGNQLKLTFCVNNFARLFN